MREGNIPTPNLAACFPILLLLQTLMHTKGFTGAT